MDFDSPLKKYNIKSWDLDIILTVETIHCSREKKTVETIEYI